MAQFPWQQVEDLREKYTYDIHPFSTFNNDNDRAEKKRANTGKSIYEF